MINQLKILTILPYKENYTKSKAQAAAIWVYDFLKFSRYKKDILVIGNTKGKNYLSKNYLNINIDNLGSKLSSSTIRYCNQIIKRIKDLNYDLIEIHNRPLVFDYLKKSLDKKFILYFHNDPLSMKGSSSKNERLNLLNHVDKIIKGALIEDIGKNHDLAIQGNRAETILGTKTETIMVSLLYNFILAEFILFI